MSNITPKKLFKIETSGAVSLPEYLSVPNNVLIIYLCKILPPGHGTASFIARDAAGLDRVFIFHVLLVQPSAFSIFSDLGYIVIVLQLL